MSVMNLQSENHDGHDMCMHGPGTIEYPSCDTGYLDRKVMTVTLTDVQSVIFL